jgi:hypothetical protein
MNQQTPSKGAVVIRGLVPMIHVQDVERSLAFYRLLGFDVGNRVPRHGPMEWAWLYTTHAADWKTGANLMLTRADCPVDASEQLCRVQDPDGYTLMLAQSTSDTP